MPVLFLHLAPPKLRKVNSTLLEVLKKKLGNMLVHLGLWLQVTFFHTVLESSVDAEVCVKLLHETADRNAGVCGSLLHRLLRVGKPHKLGKVGN